MTNFIPGKVIKEFATKKGRQVVIRYPKWEDLEVMTVYINEVSQEDTFVTFSGETIAKDGEMYYLAEMIKSMELQNAIYLACFDGEKLAATCTILRDLQNRKRSYHVGIFGITVAKDFRGEGIGEELATLTIEQAKQKIPGLKTLILNVFSPNEIAQNLYKKLGFAECGRMPKTVWFHNDYVDEIKMYRNL